MRYSVAKRKIVARWEKMLFENKKGATQDLRDFLIHYKTFRTMKKIRRAKFALPNYFCVNLEVKRLYINPLVLLGKSAATKRICDISKRAARLQKKFLAFHDAPFGCVKFASADFVSNSASLEKKRQTPTH